MFDIASTELLLVVIVAVVVIGPKDLPRALYKVGQLVGKARAMSRHFRSGVDAMMHEVEIEEMEKKWAAENKRIMEQYPSTDPVHEADTASETGVITDAEAAATDGKMEALPVSDVGPDTEPDKADETNIHQPDLPFGEASTGGKSA